MKDLSGNKFACDRKEHGLNAWSKEHSMRTVLSMGEHCLKGTLVEDEKIIVIEVS